MLYLILFILVLLLIPDLFWWLLSGVYYATMAAGWVVCLIGLIYFMNMKGWF